MNARQRRTARRAMGRNREKIRTMLARVFPGVTISDGFSAGVTVTGRFRSEWRPAFQFPRDAK